jgi:biotin transport system substrate-specific component
MNIALPISTTRKAFQDLAIVIASALLLVSLGNFLVPLPFTPLPLSLRMQAMFALALMIGSQRALLSIFLYLILSPTLLLGPCGGYVVGQCVAVLAIGSMRDHPVKAFAMGTAIVYAFGSAYLATFIGVSKAILLGIVPFVIGDLIKSWIGVQFVRRYENI